jgi:hypothetical protein
MVKARQSKSAPRAISDPLEAVPWTIEFANTNLSNENWRDLLWEWFGVALRSSTNPIEAEASQPALGGRPAQWHYGGMRPTLAHIQRAQESICETLETLADEGTVPGAVVEKVNSYLLGLHGFKFHIISDLPPDEPPNGQRLAQASGAPLYKAGKRNGDTSGGASLPQRSPFVESEAEKGGKGVQLQTLRLEPKTFDLRSLFYYRFSLFLTSPAAHRVRRCNECRGFFIQRFNHRKFYCSDSCRFRTHNKKRQGKKEGLKSKRTHITAAGDQYVWWKKYEENSKPT